MACHPPTILLAGGGSGGHIYPNLAVVERLRELDVPVTPHLLISQRPLDAQIAEQSGLGYTAIEASPLVMRPQGLLRFWRDMRRGRSQVLQLIKRGNAQAMVATGGFVSGPAVAAAAKAGLPVALVSLDAKPGRANRFTAKKAGAVFSAYPTAELPGCQTIGYPLRRAAMSSATSSEARAALGLEPEQPTLLVFAGSQGARTINRAMAELVGRDEGRAMLAGWQVLHIAGNEGEREAAAAYERGMPGAGRVRSFCDRMDLAWSAATVALTRAGAGTVAEAWANAVPSVMLPYPYHKDEHQRLNAAPMVEAGGAVVLKDLIDPAANTAQLVEHLGPILRDPERREAMARGLREHPPLDGAMHLAQWVRSCVMS